jgi:hypothetical protein
MLKQNVLPEDVAERSGTSHLRYRENRPGNILNVDAG